MSINLCHNVYIRPAYDNIDITEIKGFQLQKFFNELTEAGKHRTAKKIQILLSAVFEYAVMDDIIQKNPLKRISLPRYEETHGCSLTREEEAVLIQELKRTKSIYSQAYAFLIYTGLRRSELSSAVIEDEWVIVKSAKQRKGMKDKIRQIPISPMLEKVMPLIDFEAIKTLSSDTLTRHIKDIFPSHHVHDLRHTFITRCQECAIQREIVSLWAGHNADNSMTTLVYTHLDQNREKQIEEMKKFFYDLKF